MINPYILLLAIVVVIVVVFGSLVIVNRKTTNFEFIHVCVYPGCDFKFASNDEPITQYVANAHEQYHKTGDVSIVPGS